FTSNLLGIGNWTPNRRATQNRGDVAGVNVAAGGLSGAASTAAGNELYNLTRPPCQKEKNWNDDILYGTALGNL
ncbi:hypothetical protein, partial [Xanthomonas axonopodis]|uniref:hypothetical protein n=1 Tax=Xanthomonas axonopodis TaxID=53413 RepID=UPI001AD9EE69